MDWSAGGPKPSATKFMPATIEPTAKNCSNLTPRGLFGGRPNNGSRAEGFAAATLAATSSQNTVLMTNMAPARYHHPFTLSWCHGHARRQHPRDAGFIKGEEVSATCHDLGR